MRGGNDGIAKARVRTPTPRAGRRAPRAGAPRAGACGCGLVWWCRRRRMARVGTRRSPTRVNAGENAPQRPLERVTGLCRGRRGRAAAGGFRLAPMHENEGLVVLQFRFGVDRNSTGEVELTSPWRQAVGQLLKKRRPPVGPVHATCIILCHSTYLWKLGTGSAEAVKLTARAIAANQSGC